MAYRRRRRSRGTWLPLLGTRATSNSDLNSAGTYFTVNVPADGTPLFGILPITFDNVPDPGDQASTRYDLAGLIGSEYVIKRILGSFFCCRLGGTAGATAIQAAAVQVDAAFFVARRGDDVDGGNENEGPIGYFDQSLSENLADYSPDRQETVRLPWMWKRQWILGNSATTFGITTKVGPAFFPFTNAGYGTLREGTHIDVKSRRRVRQDERLFFICQARTWPGNDVSAQGTSVGADDELFCSLSVRVFGQLRKARNRSAF